VNSESLKYPWNSRTPERMQEMLGFLGVLDFLGFL